MKRLIPIIALFALVSCQPQDPIEKQIDHLLSQMTLAEKIGQMNQLDPSWSAEEKEAQIREGLVGSIFNIVDPHEVNRLQRMAVEETRLGIPLLVARDVIHGFRTIYPIPLGQAATFDPALVEEAARLTADEAVQAGVRWTFSPMVDVARDPRWGRVAEGYGEDTYLTSVMGAAAVRGYQGSDSIVRLAACVKHFAGYSVSEGGRDYNSTWIPEVQLRETYLPPFKAAIDAGSLSIMCAFNDINGVPASGNKHLNVDILRHEWQFDGLLVSDWGSIGNMVAHGISTDLCQTAAQSLDAQVDMDMQSNAYLWYLDDLVAQGIVSEKQLDACVRNILRMKFRLGLFDNPYCYIEDNPTYFAPEALAAAQRAAEESAFLLKNNGILPLNNSKLSIMVCGPLAHAQHDQNGTWCFDKVDSMTITPLMAFRQLAEQGEIRLIEQTGKHWSREVSAANIASLTRLARQADVVLYFGGEESILSGEARCRAHLNLPGDQSAQLRALKATGKPVVLTVMAGRPLCIGEDINLVDAVLYAFHGGTMQGPALANLIMGKVAPSGRLPITFPNAEGQIPLYYNKKNTGRPTDHPVLIDDIPVGAGQFSIGESSYWLEYGDQPLYPFGYGLTYTTFEYGPVILSDTLLTADKNSLPFREGVGYLIASCEITNTGNRTATAVPQLYVRDLVGSLTRPVRELKGFQRVTVPAGESRTVTFELTEDDLAYWHLAEGVTLGADGAYVHTAESGDFHVWIAPNAAEGQPAKITLK